MFNSQGGQYLIILGISIFLIVSGSGCLGDDPEVAINETVSSFLTALNDGDYTMAFSYYEGSDFIVPATLEVKFKNYGIQAGSIKDVDIGNPAIEETVAVVTVNCQVAELDRNGNEVSTTSKPLYFRLQDADGAWIITKVNFDQPVVLSTEDLVEIEVEQGPLDPLVDNAPLIFGLAIVILGAGLYFKKKERSAPKQKAPEVNVSMASPVAKESLYQFVRIVPSPPYQVKKKATVSVWVKNFSQVPYNDFTVVATFPSSLKIKKTTLSFGTIGPGETVKKVWKITPTEAGWFSIDRPQVMFEYGGARYAGELDGVWVQVQ